MKEQNKSLLHLYALRYVCIRIVSFGEKNVSAYIYGLWTDRMVMFDEGRVDNIV